MAEKYMCQKCGKEEQQCICKPRTRNMWCIVIEQWNKLVDENIQLQAELKKQYRQGYEDGLRAYAWWKDGVQYVGSCGTTLKQALKEQPNDLA